MEIIVVFLFLFNKNFYCFMKETFIEKKNILGKEKRIEYIQPVCFIKGKSTRNICLCVCEFFSRFF